MEIKKRIKIDSQHQQPTQWHLNKNTERRNWILRMDGVMIQSEHWIARACSEVPPLETLLLLLLYTITFSTTEDQTNQSLNAMYIMLSIWHWNHVQMFKPKFKYQLQRLSGWVTFTTQVHAVQLIGETNTNTENTNKDLPSSCSIHIHLYLHHGFP